MIEYISGPVTELGPTYAVVEAAGIGYRLEIALSTYAALEPVVSSADHSARLLVHEIIREDAHDLFGFADAGERAIFRALISVSGVGANTARMILSSVSAAELCRVIADGDSRRLKAVKGIGAKTAERIIVDLRDKIKGIAIGAAADGAPAAAPAASSQVIDEALAALVMLGFTRQQSQKALKKVFDADPSATVESAIKQAFTMM